METVLLASFRALLEKKCQAPNNFEVVSVPIILFDKNR